MAERDKADYRKLLDDHMTEAVWGNSLRVLSELLEKHHNTKVILLIDEYEVPLAKAHANGYYDQMISLIRNLLGEALKTNNSLKFAVLQKGDAENVERIFTEYLKRTISIRDTAVRTHRKENYYQGVLIEILGVKDRWGISSNREMGDRKSVVYGKIEG